MQNAKQQRQVKRLEKHKKLTLYLVRKFNMPMEKAYDLALKIYKV